MSPTAVLSCLWYRNASVGTNMFSDCRNLIALKPINLRESWPQNAPKAKPCRVVRLPCQAPVPSRLFEGARQPERHKLTMAIRHPCLKWYVTAIINIYMTSQSVSLRKTVQHCQDYLFRWLIKFRTQYNTNTGPQTDVWHILWRQREREAVATDFLSRPYATPEWRWFWHANKIYGVTVLMLKGLYRNMPVCLEGNFMILEHKVSFGFVPSPSSILIY